MKLKFSNTDLVHCFAQRTQSTGEAFNMFFEDTNKLYSYGRHYLLAEFKEINNELCIIINDKGYSVTTQKHISLVRQATRQYKQYFTTNIDLQLVSNQIEWNYKKLLKAKKPEIYINEILRLFNSLISFPLNVGDTFKKDARFKAIEKIYKSVSSPEQISKAKEVQKTIEAKAKKEAAKKLKIDLKKFENYEIDYFRNEEDFLRISLDKTKIETSQSVNVSIDEAKLLYTMIKAKKDIKGHRISNYTVISINGVLTIGCHKINMDSVRKIGETILKM